MLRFISPNLDSSFTAACQRFPIECRCNVRMSGFSKVEMSGDHIRPPLGQSRLEDSIDERNSSRNARPEVGPSKRGNIRNPGSNQLPEQESFPIVVHSDAMRAGDLTPLSCSGIANTGAQPLQIVIAPSGSFLYTVDTVVLKRNPPSGQAQAVKNPSEVRRVHLFPL